jgi:hypothetical protein
MTASSFQPERKPSALTGKVDELRQALKKADPTMLALNTDAQFERSGEEEGRFVLPLWENEIVITYPDFIAHDGATGAELTVDVQAMLLYHFQTSRGAPVAGRWISFSELPDGKFYTTAFQGYTGGELARTFHNDLASFERAAEKAGGKREELGGASYSFTALPRIRLLVVYWEGDDDFPPSVQVLFDAAVVQHLPTDVCAILGSMMARRIKKSKA